MADVQTEAPHSRYLPIVSLLAYCGSLIPLTVAGAILAGGPVATTFAAFWFLVTPLVFNTASRTLGSGNRKQSFALQFLLCLMVTAIYGYLYGVLPSVADTGEPTLLIDKALYFTSHIAGPIVIVFASHYISRALVRKFVWAGLSAGWGDKN